LARYRHDRTIALAGRRDDEVKIRGHRVNLSDIESVLTDIPGVERTAVVGQGSQAERVCLRAFVVPKAGLIGD
jgi:acyl-coenzyme A synthetase/AMP-(fatty) acid ligase